MKARKSERGANLVEAALTLGILFLMLLGIIEFARAYKHYQCIVNAAREGARFAVAPETVNGALPTSDEIRARVQTVLDSGSVRGANVTLDPAIIRTTNGIDTSYTRVAISAPFSFVVLPLGSLSMSADSEMRNETN